VPAKSGRDAQWRDTTDDDRSKINEVENSLDTAAFIIVIAVFVPIVVIHFLAMMMAG
jgi:hypothetical protein